MGKKGAPSAASSSSSSSSANNKGGGAAGGSEGEAKKRPPKGHRQKGAGAVIADKGPIERGGVVVQSWQRVPSTLLQEHCQREKRPRPSYREVSLKPGEKGAKMQVVLPDPKGQHDRALRFLPTVASRDATVAKENAALLALLHLTPSLPLERKLPEPYKTTWLQSAAASATAAGKAGGGGGGKKPPPQQPPPPPTPAAAGAAGNSKGGAHKPPPAPTADDSTTKSTASVSSSGSGSVTTTAPAGPVVLSSALTYASMKERQRAQEAKRQARLAREHDRARRRRVREDHRLLMSGRMRRVVEAALGITGTMEEEEEEEEEDDTEGTSSSSEDEGEEQGEDKRRMEALVASLSAMGFTEKQGRHAVRAVERSCNGAPIGIEEALDFLLLHLPEESLPARFDPRGRNFDVVLPDNANPSATAPQAAAASLRASPPQWGRQFGLLPPDCAALASLEDEMGRLSMLGAAVYASVPVPASSSGEGGGGEGEGWEEEVEALRVIYGGEEEEASITLTPLSPVEGAEWRPTHLLTLSSSCGLPPQHRLKIWLSPSYPHAIPSSLVPACFALLEGPKATAGLQRALAATAARSIGNPALYELLLTATESLEEGGGKEETETVYFLSSPPAPSAAPSPSPSSSPSTQPPPRQSHRRHRPPPRSSSSSVSGGFWSSSSPSSPLPTSNRPHSTPEGRRMQEARSKLPAARAKEEFLGMVASNRVVLVAGETGCGKTTQIPQFLLEDAEAKGQGSKVKVVVAQPRRIAAIGVAQRVAEERGEGPPGSATSSVGYMIRGETKMGPGTRLAFCTTGIVLRRLQAAGGQLGGITHLVVDEVHERNLDADFLLLLAKRLLSSSSGTPPLRLILMSATMDAARVARYFQACNLPVVALSSSSSSSSGKPLLPPVLSIPGFTHPVEDIWLESLPPLLGPAATPKWLQKLAEAGPADTREREAQLDYRLLKALILHVASPAFAAKHPGPAQGSVLVFLPGVGEITRLCSLLHSSSSSSRYNEEEEEGEGEGDDGAQASSLWVLPLHGALQGKEQALVFQVNLPAEKSKKVVIATNVAETSITIPDVTVVIDAGRVKENGYDPITRMAALVEGWASQDSIRQRRGRAGRVRPGLALHLLSSWTHAALPLHSTPEIRRAPLEQVVLQAMAGGYTAVSSEPHSTAVCAHPRAFFHGMLDPPEDERLEAAVKTLLEVQALEAAGESQQHHQQPQQPLLSVTPLGKHLAALPCPVRLGKMLVYGAVLGVLGPTLSIAAGMQVRSPLLNLQGHPQADSIQRARENHLGGARLRKSDHLLYALLMERVGSLEGGMAARRRFCREVGVAFERVQEMQTLTLQFSRDLAALGFTAEACNDAAESMLEAVDERGKRAYWRLVKAAVCGGLYPNVMKLVRPQTRYAKVAGGAVAVDSSARELKFFVRTHAPSPFNSSSDTAASSLGPQPRGRIPGERVFIHPSSVNFSQGVFTVPWLVYSEVVRTSKAFIRDCSEVSPYALLLAAHTLKQIHSPTTNDEGTLVLDADGWVRFAAVGRIGALVGALKRRVDALLEAKVRDPSVDIATAPETQALVKLIASEGMG